ncbi:MAG TPA: FadR/GntR family transcriptional regulator [Methylomirabilota bacterium]|nr:FadR/GntR family transcriptional regulator [Methylomirabilota bacterium]
MFQTVARAETLASKVTAQIEALITGNQLAPGSRLPAERELALQFGVSRTVIREAVRALMARGLLEVKSGSGTVVRVPSAEAVTKSMTLFLRAGQTELDHAKVMEVRRLLEVEIAGLAAERRTEEDLDTLRRIVEDQVGIREDRDRFVSWDVSFHAALAAATHNKLFPLLLDSVVATLRQVRELGFDLPTTPGNAIKFHRAILHQVEARSRTGARRAMAAHLEEAENTICRALELRARAGRRGTPP